MGLKDAAAPNRNPTTLNLSKARSRVGASYRKDSTYPLAGRYWRFLIVLLGSIYGRRLSGAEMVGDRGCVVGNRKNAHGILLKVFNKQPNQNSEFYHKHKDF